MAANELGEQTCMSEAKLSKADLRQFTGSEQWYRHGLVLVSAFLLGLGSSLLMKPCPSARPGCASRNCLRGEPKRNAVFALFLGETASAFWAEGGCGAPRGSAPKQLSPAGAQRSCRRQAETGA